MRVASTFEEAVRNTRTGTSRAVSLAILFAAVLVVLLEFELSTTAELFTRADNYVAAGGSTWILESVGNVDRDRCEGLPTTRRIGESGAIRRGKETVLTVLPGNPVPTFEASSGWWNMVLGPSASSLMASQELAETLSPTGDLDRRAMGDVEIGGVFPWPDDGRSPNLTYALVARGTGAVFDECWVTMTDPSDSPVTLLRSVLLRSVDSPEDAQIRQLNGSLGPFSMYENFARRTSRQAWLIACLAGAVIAGASVWLRALELATAQSLGVPRVNQALQVLLETGVWVGMGSLLATAYAASRSGDLSPTHFADLCQLATPLLGASIAGAALTVPAALGAIRPRQIDKHLRRRAG